MTIYIVIYNGLDTRIYLFILLKSKRKSKWVVKVWRGKTVQKRDENTDRQVFLNQERQKKKTIYVYITGSINSGSFVN